MKHYTNYRGGRYHTGMYTVSAHVPMGENVGASPDGRNALKPLADGGCHLFMAEINKDQQRF